MSKRKKRNFIPVIVIIFVVCGTQSSNLSFAAPGIQSNKNSLRSKIIRTAKKFIGTRYRFGGTGRSGFDCSGFVQFVFYQHGVIIPRTSKGQYDSGNKIRPVNAKPGDLVFFKINKKSISHVGIYIGDNSFIHSPSTGKKVSIAKMKIDYWKERFAGFVRLL